MSDLQFTFFDMVPETKSEGIDPILSEEQKAFVEDKEILDSKMLCGPGSGKSTCIIGKHIFLVRNGFFKKNEIAIITFTRHACQDLQSRIVTWADYARYFEVTPSHTIFNVRTIDSLAFQVMKKWNKCRSDSMVQILSPWLLHFLKEQTTNEKKLRQVEALKHVKVLFVDEAQDLNQIQYDIIMKLKELLHLTIYLVGDPNQSIYGFRDSSSAHLIHFPGKEYKLTQNYRSSPAIVHFTEYLKPHKQYETRAFTTDTHHCLPRIIHTDIEEFGMFLTKYISTFSGDLSEIAILCPTKGNRVKSNGISCGLSRMANLLDANQIPFVQLYQESSTTEETTQYDTVPGHLNLLTFHGAKGKEWTTVICADVWFELMNRVPTAHQHTDHLYLLYVAMTRAKKELIIFMGREKHPSPYLYHIPMHFYEGFIYVKQPPKFNEQEDDRIYNVTQLIEHISPECLLQLDPHLKYEKQTKQIYGDYRKLVQTVIKNDMVLFGLFLENLFSMQCSAHKLQQPRNLPVIETILSGETIYLPNNHFVILHPLWKSCQNWEDYDQIKSGQPAWILLLVEKYFKRTILWEKHFLSCNQFQHIIQAHKDLIYNCHEVYMNSNISWEKKIQPLFYLTLVSYCYNNNHLFNIKNFGKHKQHLIDTCLFDLFHDMNRYAKTIATQNYEEQVHIKVPYLKIIGRIDLKFLDGTIVELKASQKTLSLPNILQLLIYTMSDATNYHDLITRPVALYNFISGEVVSLRFTIPESSMMNIFCILASASRQLLQRVPLLCSVQTTGMEDHLKLVQISLKDYKYNYYVFKNQLINIHEPLPMTTTLLTGITSEDITKGMEMKEVEDKLQEIWKVTAPNCALMLLEGVGRIKKIMECNNMLPEEIDIVEVKTVAQVYGNINFFHVRDVYKTLYGKQYITKDHTNDEIEMMQDILYYLNYKL